MSSVEIKDLLDENRYPTGWKVIWLGLYIPLGLFLAFIRSVIAIQACVVAALCPKVPILKSYIYYCARVALGIIIKEENVSHKSQQVRIIVSNHVTSVDHLAVHFATESITPYTWELPSFLHWALGIRDLGMRHQDRQNVIASIKRHISKFPQQVLFLPEGTTTNGQVGLLKFSVLPFSIGMNIQPITLKTRRPFMAQIAPTALATNKLSDLFYFMFVPYTVFTIRYLVAVYPQSDESPEEFSTRVQNAIAQSLGIVCTQYTAHDKAEYEKRYLLELNQPVLTPNSSSPSNSDLLNMARQVEEVLPYVPRDVILRDLERTHSIDVTISNILDGSVRFTPLPQSSRSPRGASPISRIGQTSVVPGPSRTSDTSSPFSTALFSKSARERMLSFQERKAQLIDEARQKYIEKHNLKIAGYNC